jgi:aryl-alcohol dehydrogenase-like predicted oxidoreductase
MEYGNVAGVNKKISRLVQGTVMLSTGEMEASVDLLDEVFELGCNSFDTAHVYAGGQAERVLGEWMERRGNREEVFILSKGAHHNADRKRVTTFDIMSDLSDSLARLRTDYIDLYLLHRDDPDVPVSTIVDTLNEHREAGRFNAFGGSNWTTERIAEANAYAESKGVTGFAASSPNFSLAEQVEEPWAGCLSLSGLQGEAARKWYGANEMPVFTWSTLAQGFFAGKLCRENFEEMKAELPGSCVSAYCHEQNFDRLDRARELAEEKGKSVPQIALAFVLNQPLNIHTLIGCASGNELRANMEALEIDLSQEEIAWLDLKQDKR